MISIWDLVSFTAGLICFGILLIDGIMTAVKKHTK